MDYLHKISWLFNLIPFGRRSKGASHKSEKQKFNSNHSPYSFASNGFFYSRRDKGSEEVKRVKEQEHSHAFQSADYKRKWLISGTTTLI